MNFLLIVYIVVSFTPKGSYESSLKGLAFFIFNKLFLNINAITTPRKVQVRLLKISMKHSDHVCLKLRFTKTIPLMVVSTAKHRAQTLRKECIMPIPLL